MFPFGWSAGEPQKPRETFKDFQGFTDTAREYAALHGLHRSKEQRFLLARQNDLAANDNMPEGANHILISDNYMEMLACWIACERDMMLTKLSYISS